MAHEDDPYGLTREPWPVSRADDESDDEVTLAGLIGVPEHSLILAIGGPWSPGWTRPTPSHAAFVGRIGDCVVLDVRAVDRQVSVGPAVWTRQSPYPVWEIGPPIATFTIPRPTVPDQTAFLRALGAAVDATVESQPPTWVVCRTCSGIIPEAYMFGGDMCDGCATRLLGVVF